MATSTEPTIESLKAELAAAQKENSELREQLEYATNGDLKAALHKAETFEAGFRRQQALHQAAIAEIARLREQLPKNGSL